MTGSFAGGPLAAVIAAKREEQARATLATLGLTLLVYSSPDEVGNLMGVVARDGNVPERRFATVEELDQFIAEETAARRDSGKLNERETAVSCALHKAGLAFFPAPQGAPGYVVVSFAERSREYDQRRFATLDEAAEFAEQVTRERRQESDALDATRYAIHTARQLVRSRPYVAQAVHYVSYGTPGREFTSECRAATVTSVLPTGYRGTVSLCTLNPAGLFFNQDVTHDPGSVKDAALRKLQSGEPLECADRIYKGGTWHFIPETAP
jgi:hypothetical protein